MPWPMTYICKSWDEVPFSSFPYLGVLSRSLFLPHHGTGGCWLVQAPSSQRHPIQAQIPHLEVLGNVPYAWFGQIPVGAWVIYYIVLTRLVHFFFALLCHCTLFAPPALIIDGRPHLAVFPLPCHFCCDTIIALPFPCLCWSGAIVPSPLPHWGNHHIRTTATATTAGICLSCCHCCQHMSLALKTSSLAVLTNADANVAIVSPGLWQCWRRCHCCMFFFCRRRPTPPLQSSTAAQRHLPTLPGHCHLPMPPQCRCHLPFLSMMIVVCWFYSSKCLGVLLSTLWLRI